MVAFAVAIAIGFRFYAYSYGIEQIFSLELPILLVLQYEIPALSLSLTVILNALLCIILVFSMQVQIVKHSLLRSRNFLPLFFSLVLCSLNPNMANAILNFVLLLALVYVYFQLFDCYRISYPQVKIFNLSMVMGILCLLDIRLICLMPVFWGILIRNRSFSAKSFIASLIGLSIAFALFAFYLFIAKEDISQVTELFRELTEIERQMHTPLTRARSIYLGTIFALCTISWLNLKRCPEREQIRITLANNRVALVCTNMLSVFFLTSDLLLAATIVPMTILLGYLFSSISGWIYRILFILFIAAIFTNFVFLLWKY